MSEFVVNGPVAGGRNDVISMASKAAVIVTQAMATADFLIPGIAITLRIVPIICDAD